MVRRSRWVDVAFNQVLTNASENLFDMLDGMAPVDVAGTTLVRSIYRLDFYTNSLTTAAGIQNISIGSGITSREAFTSGSVSIADPDDGDEAPMSGWIFRTRGAVHADPDSPLPPWRVDADIRGMRKIDRGQLFLKINNVAQLGTAQSVKMTGLTRSLILLP